MSDLYGPDGSKREMSPKFLETIANEFCSRQKYINQDTTVSLLSSLTALHSLRCFMPFHSPLGPRHSDLQLSSLPPER